MSTSLLEELAEAEAARCAWMAAPDPARWDELFDRELIYTHSTGRRDTAEGLRRYVLARTVQYRSVSHQLEKASRLGAGTAAGWGTAQLDLLTSEGAARSIQSATSGLWRLGPTGKWRLLSLHMTSLPET
ncbi:DUF4440 domain-containing protein [Sinomonas soli]